MAARAKAARPARSTSFLIIAQTLLEEFAAFGVLGLGLDRDQLARHRGRRDEGIGYVRHAAHAIGEPVALEGLRLDAPAVDLAALVAHPGGRHPGLVAQALADGVLEVA